MWIFDQWMHLLAVLAWPAVAVIVGLAWVHGCRLLLDAAELWGMGFQEAIENAAKRACSTAIAVSRQMSPVPTTKREAVETTCERALLAVLAARGGFPARQNEAPGRSLVREVREMYLELEQPTPRPEPAAGSQAPGMTDLMVSPESLDEYLDMDGGLDGAVDDLYAGMMATDDDTRHSNDEEGDLG